MNIGSTDKLSLLASLKPLETIFPGNTLDVQGSHAFAERLAQALDASGETATPQDKAHAMAELLNLQMIRTTLTLSGDSVDEISLPRPNNQTSSQLKALIASYTANLPATSEKTVQEQPSPRPAVSLLQDLQPATSSETPLKVTANPSWLDPIIANASQRYGVDVGLIKAVIKAESNFNPNAVSHAGAQGLMQLMPATARSLGVTNSFDPQQNVMAGTRFLKDMLNRYHGNVDSALAAYNWGPGNVDKKPDHLPRETRGYLARVKQLYNSYTG